MKKRSRDSNAVYATTDTVTLIVPRPPVLYTSASHAVRLPSSLWPASQTSKPNPFMHSLYASIVGAHALAGSAAFEKSMHSSRLDFSSLHTQQG